MNALCFILGVVWIVIACINHNPQNELSFYAHITISQIWLSASIIISETT